MNITIDTQQIEVPTGQHSQLKSRFKRVFGRLGEAIHSVRISLRSVSTPPGQPEQVCQLNVTLADGGHVVVTGRGKRMARAIGETLRRARFLVGKEIGKRRSRKRRQSSSEPLGLPA